MLLALVAHRRGGRIDPDVATARLDEARQDLEEGRLADAVGADHSQAGPGADRERHAVEDGASPALVAEVMSDERRRW
jgi:hypothetical protein